jgi:hypothetical protein
MPSKTKQSKASKSKPVRRSMDTIVKVMEEVAAARAGGMTLAKALGQVGVPYNTFLKWTKKYGKTATAKPVRLPKGGKTGPRRTPDEVIRILDEIKALRDAGKTKIQALAELGVNPFTYRYWRKKFGATVSSTVTAYRKASISKTSKIDIVSLLVEMTENRKKRKELEQAEKQIQLLDARFLELRKKLET